MNKKSMATLALSAIVAGVVVSGTNANMFNFTGDNDSTEMRSDSGEFRGRMLDRSDKHFKKGINGNMKGLTDEEKVALESMTDDEKKVFFTEKRTQRLAEMEARKVERQAHEAVIDKLIDGETLTAEEKVILEDIKVKRAERKTLFAEREAKMEEIKAIMDKKINGETLTDEEKTKLEELREGNKDGIGGFGGFMHR